MSNIPAVILDTDFSSDVDDFTDVAFAAGMHRLGLIDLVAVTCDTSHSKSPGAISAVLTWWAVTTPAIGTWKGASLDPSAGTYPDDIYDNYPRNGVGLASTVADAVSIMRQKLAARTAKDATIICTGLLSNIYFLMLSGADGDSPLTGMQLISQKVKAIYITGGIFPSGNEWNLAHYPAGSSYVAANWPTDTPLYWVDIQMANNTIVGAGFQGSMVSTNLMRYGYDHGSKGGIGRPAWGTMGTMAIASNNADFTMTRGVCTINSVSGVNSFVESPTANQFYLIKTQSDAFYVDRIERVLTANVANSPLLTSWGGKPALLLFNL